MRYHSNYSVIEDYDDDYVEEMKIYSQKNGKRVNLKKFLPIILIVIVIGIFGYIYYQNVIYKNSYSYLEKLLEGSAVKYVKDNNLTVSKSFFIESDKLNVRLKENCNNLSGVIAFQDGTYKALLNCDDYQSKVVNNSDEYITLNGNEIMFLGTSNTYQELGYQGNLDVKISSNVLNQKGIYEVKYNVIKNSVIADSLKRLVIVVDDKVVNSYYPNLSLKGEEVIYLNKGDTYSEQGCNAFDSKDGNISNKVMITSNLNVYNSGEYEVIYKVENSRGFTNLKTRKIVVMDNDNNELEIHYYITPLNVVNDKKTITFYIASKNYKYTILPNGSESYANTIEYMVTENGNYNFIFYDQNGNFINKDILINDIDKTLPSITCKSETYEKNTIISTVASDNDGISSYQYIVNSKNFGEIFSNTYNANIGEATSVKVIVKDNAGNKKEAVCSIEDKVIRKQPIQINNSKSYISCGNGPKYNEEMFKYIKYAGYKTREGVVAAAIYLATLPNRIPYFWSGGHYHSYNFRDYGKKSPDNGDNFIGISRLYGCDAKMSFGGTDKQKDGNYYRYGLDCSGFIAWAIMNGGYYTGDKNQKITINTGDNFSSSVGGIFNTGIKMSQAKGKVKPGDIVYMPGHVGMIIDVSASKVTIAEERGADYGLVITTQGYNNTRFKNVILMDNFYKNYKKSSPLWSGFK